MEYICNGCDGSFKTLTEYKTHNCDIPDSEIVGITIEPKTLTELRLQLEELAMTGEGLTPSQAILKMLQLIVILEKRDSEA